MSRDPRGGRVLCDYKKFLWQGRRDPEVRLGMANRAGFGFALFFAGAGAIWMTLAAQAGGCFRIFGPLHFAVGVGRALPSIFWPTWRRRHTWHTLTDRRAFIATDIRLRGRRLKSHAVDTRLPPSIDRQDPANIRFASNIRQTRTGSRTWRNPLNPSLPSTLRRALASGTPSTALHRRRETPPVPDIASLYSTSPTMPDSTGTGSHGTFSALSARKTRPCTSARLMHPQHKMPIRPGRRPAPA